MPIKKITTALLFTACLGLAALYAQTAAQPRQNRKIPATAQQKAATAKAGNVPQAALPSEAEVAVSTPAAGGVVVSTAAAKGKTPAKKEAEKKIDKTAGILIVTRPIDTAWKDSINQAVADLKAQTGPIRVVYTGGDVKEMQSAVDALTSQGAQSIITVPLFLSQYDDNLQYITESLNASTDTWRQPAITDKNIVSKLKITVTPAIGHDPVYISKFVDQLKQYKVQGRKNFIIVTAPDYPNIEGKNTYAARYSDMKKLATVLGEVAKYDESHAYLLSIKAPGALDADFINIKSIDIKTLAGGEPKKTQQEQKQDTLENKIQELAPKGAVQVTVFGLSGEASDIDIKKNIRSSFYTYVPPPVLDAEDLKQIILKRIKM